MLSLALRAVLAAQTLVLALAAAGAGAPAPACVLLALGGVLGLNLLIVAAAYGTARFYAAALLPTGGAAAGGGALPARTWRCALREVLALFAAFVVIQPFERWWMGPESLGPTGGRPPILLVHGYLCNRGMWWWLRRRLRAGNAVVATVNLEPVLADLDLLAARLAARVESVLAETGAGKVLIVTHSLGGLVSRAYLRQYGAQRVAGLVTLAAPHHGSRVARLGLGENARQMRPGSAWLRRLNEAPPPSVPVANLWTPDDEMVAPPDSARLPGSRETVLAGIGHVAMAFSPRVVAAIEQFAA